MAYVRKYKTGSGATGVQVCFKEGNEVVRTIHVGSAKSEEGLSKLMKKARDIIEREKGTRTLFDLHDYEK